MRMCGCQTIARHVSALLGRARSNDTHTQCDHCEWIQCIIITCSCSSNFYTALHYVLCTLWIHQLTLRHNSLSHLRRCLVFVCSHRVCIIPKDPPNTTTAQHKFGNCERTRLMWTGREHVKYSAATSCSLTRRTLETINKRSAAQSGPEVRALQSLLSGDSVAGARPIHANVCGS